MLDDYDRCGEPPHDTHDRLPSCVVIDDDDDIRRLLEISLDLDPRFGTIASAACQEEAMQVVTKLQPDTVILDLGLPGVPGLALLHELRRAAPDCRIVVFSGLADDDLAGVVIAAGGAALLAKGLADVREIADVLLPLPVGLERGTEVEVQSVLDGRWATGFSVTTADEHGYWLQRGDGSRLPARVAADRVRESGKL